MPDEKINNHHEDEEIKEPVQEETTVQDTDISEQTFEGEKADEETEQEHHKKRGFFGFKETHLSKKELRELNRNLEESRERIKLLEKELAEKTAKADEYYDKYLRLHAETENFKKRTMRELADSIKYASESLIIEMFPALNNFQMALLSAENVPETRNFAVGMEMILKQVMDVMRSRGLEEINPAQGEDFDPYLHQAIVTITSETCEKERVSKVIRKGYKLHDKVLQPASVEVEIPGKEKTEKPSEKTDSAPSAEEKEELNNIKDKQKNNDSSYKKEE